MKRSVTVNLAGHTLNLRTENDPTYVKSLARYFSEKIESVRRVSGKASGHQVALLAGLQVVDEFFQLREEKGALQDTVRVRVKRALELLEEPESM